MKNGSESCSNKSCRTMCTSLYTKFCNVLAKGLKLFVSAGRTPLMGPPIPSEAAKLADTRDQPRINNLNNPGNQPNQQTESSNLYRNTNGQNGPNIWI